MLPALKGSLDKLFCNHQNVVLSNGLFRVGTLSFHLETEPPFKMYFFYPDSGHVNAVYLKEYLFHGAEFLKSY